MLTPGQPAPDFTLPSDSGLDVTLSAQVPSKVVLFFYPKDDTPGCTTESIAFTALADQFQTSDCVVYGISKDTIAKHEKFRAKHDLGVALLSDADNTVCEDYGVWVEKNMYGKKYMGIVRTTVLVNSDGTIAQVWNKVKVAGHAEEVLDAVKAL